MINKNKYTRTTTGVLKALHNTQLYIFQDAKQPQLFSFHNMDSCNPVFKIWNVQTQIGESPYGCFILEQWAEYQDQRRVRSKQFKLHPPDVPSYAHK